MINSMHNMLVGLGKEQMSILQEKTAWLYLNIHYTYAILCMNNKCFVDSTFKKVNKKFQTKYFNLEASLEKVVDAQTHTKDQISKDFNFHRFSFVPENVWDAYFLNKKSNITIAVVYKTISE